jgi:hypothetical protein
VSIHASVSPCILCCTASNCFHFTITLTRISTPEPAPDVTFLAHVFSLSRRFAWLLTLGLLFPSKQRAHSHSHTLNPTQHIAEFSTMAPHQAATAAKAKKTAAVKQSKDKVVKRLARGYHTFRNGTLNVTPKGGEKDM